MTGEVVECSKCKAQMRWGFPSLAVDFALSKRFDASREQVIEDFFEFNKGVLRGRPKKCPKCGAKAEFLKAVHVYQ